MNPHTIMNRFHFVMIHRPNATQGGRQRATKHTRVLRGRLFQVLYNSGDGELVVFNGSGKKLLSGNLRTQTVVECKLDQAEQTELSMLVTTAGLHRKRKA